ncbi:MAG: DUF2924 domain-containing protein [Proteobacteria bacterium]|nr:DUF2924 domain-containing protein [Pseudomonadota bacterium]MDA0967370.1 DUF2924 domain-containing protein [Pseudomonadota bacterium]
MQNTSIKQLKDNWRKCFKDDPPPRASQDFMQGHIQWTNQASEYGGLKRKINTQVKRLTQQLREGTDFMPDSNLVIKPGTRLIRQHKGEKHEVITIEKGFRYKDKEYTSLSTIARHITGTNWNGKVFFGVKKR